MVRWQAQTGALLQLGGPDLLEFLEDPSLIRRCDADTIIAHADHDVAAVAMRAGVDVTAFGREFQGIGEQVEKHLLEHALVGLDDTDVVGDLEPQGDP